MRIRTVKPEFWRSESLFGLPDFTLLVAIGLLNYADDEGFFNANPALIKADLFPLRDECSSIPVAVTELSNRGYLELYEGTDGRTYGRVTKFLEHQVINKPKKSKVKDLCIRKTGELRLSGIDTVSIPSGTGNREQGMEEDQGEGKNSLQLRADKLFNRRPETAWDRSELKAWDGARAAVAATSDDDWALLERWFALPQEKTRSRKGLAALLNNWNTEISRAQIYERDHPRSEFGWDDQAPEAAQA